MIGVAHAAAASGAGVVIDVRVAGLDSLPAADDGAAWRQRLHPGERAACHQHRRPLPHLAARLMAKRACLAVLGPASGGDLLDVEIAGAGPVRPHLRFHGSLAWCAQPASPRFVDVSMSHTDGHAGALAVMATGAAHTCGFDLLDVPRWQRAVRRGGTALLQRITASGEAMHDHSAARFALKECVVKAIGGMPPGGRFTDIAVTFDDDGQPGLATRGAVAAFLDRAGMAVVHAQVTGLTPRLLGAGVVLAARPAA